MTEPTSLPEWNEWARRPYLVEVARQCVCALRAAALLNVALRQEGLGTGAWFAAQALLDAAANVSKLLDPAATGSGTRGRWAVQRGERLRELLGVGDDSPVLDRAVRNHFAHLDDRIDAWLLGQPQLTVEQVEAGEPQAYADAAPPPLRVIHPEDGVIAFRDHEVNIPELVAELERLLIAARQIEPLANTHPDLAALLAGLPPFPPELRLSAPSRRPDEPVTTGLDVGSLPPLEEALGEAVRRAAQVDQETTDDEPPVH